ncbi:MAG TPA: T9SS type A sorting domain-containing protein, partial [Candidatus Krumholzibacteriaceae bacterium]
SPIMGYNVWRMIPGGGGPMATSASTAKAPAVPRSKLLALLADPATAKGVRVSGSEAVSLGLPEGEWESVGFWFATRDTLYNIAVPTKNDSTEAGIPREIFIVTAHTSMAGVFIASEPDSGYSVDNLAPGLTPGFAGAEMASPHGLALSWTQNAASDIGKYNVYRGDDASFVPDVSNLFGSTDATTLFDGSWVFSYHYFYKLVAVDRHGNMGPATLLRPEDVKVGALLQSYAAALTGSFVEITWKVSEAGADVRFVVMRAEAAGGVFEELDAPEISRDGLSFSMSDKSCEPGTSYRYRIDVADEAGRRTLFETDAISTPAMPFTLYQNHPNPFNPSTTISYYVPASGQVTLDVYDSSGRLVVRLANSERQSKGTHSVEWRGFDSGGRSVSSGVYFYRLTSGKETISKKMVLLR